MHDLAINLKKSGNEVTGSDDKIYEPSKTNLKKNNLYPKKLGYFKKNISKNLDFIRTGMHTKGDNIELQTAKKNISYFIHTLNSSGNPQIINIEL